MRIENITSESLEGMSDAELRYLRSRCLNIFDRYFAKSDVQKAVGMDRRWFLTKYLLLRSEMENRSIKLFRERPLDVEVHNRIFKASIWKLDVPAMGDMIAIPNYVSVCGEFVQSPVSTEKIDVVIRTAKEHRNEAFETKISTLIKEQTNKEPNFIYEPKGPNESYIPLFDLILKSHDETRKMKMAKEVKKEKITIKKPEETENTIRIPVGPDCEVTATITIDKGQGIQALYCGKIKKVRTFLFDKRVKAWTMASARAWIKEQKEKMEKAIIEKLDKAEKAMKKKRSISSKKHVPIKTEKKHVKLTLGKQKFLHPKSYSSISNAVYLKKALPEFRIMKIDKVQKILGGVVYEPNVEDTQGDFTDAKEIEKAMYKFMVRYAKDSKTIRINHEGKKYHFPIMEVFQAEGDGTKKGSQILKAGTWWLEIKVTNDKIWEMAERREIEGFSMGGHSKAKA